MPGNAPDLKHLYDQTQVMLNAEGVITRALDWVDQIVPKFASACRATLQTSGPEPVEAWLDWVNSDKIQVIEEAGKGAVYEWRQSWLKILLTVTRALKQSGSSIPAEDCQALAHGLWTGHVELAVCFPPEFWRHLIDYLTSPLAESAAARAVHPMPGFHQSFSFPLVLSHPIQDGASEMKVILAEFFYETTTGSTGAVVLHPEQAALRCMDAQFAHSIAHASDVVKAELRERFTSFPDIRIRLQTVKPAHERILAGMVLGGPSAGGALAIGLHGLLIGNISVDAKTAISFALSKARSGVPDGNCHAVAGIDEKAPGCMQQGVRRLILEADQQQKSASYARAQGLETVGAATFAEAVSIAIGRKIVLLYHRHAEQDLGLAVRLEAALTAAGHRVFIDRNLPIGIEWARTIKHWIQDADIVIPILSAQSLVSEMLAYEIETAHEARQRSGSKPCLLPIRVDYEGPLPGPIAYILDPLHYALWRSVEDDPRLMEELARSFDHEKRPPFETPPHSSFRHGSWPDNFEPFDGLVPLDSPFYVSRKTDQEFFAAIGQRHSIILLKGPRQTGKSSLLARGLDHAEQTGFQVALTDFQKMSRTDLSSLAAFYRALGRMLARELNIDASLEDLWIDRRSENINFEEYVEDHVLPKTGSLVWAIDEADRLFTLDYCSDVFGLFRSWANERQGRAHSPWARLTLSIAYATEAHLFIQDQNQSPFNIGTRLELEDFTQPQIALLNVLYGRPLRTEEETANFHDLVGGHPYLVRRGLYAMRRDQIEVRQFAAEASRDSGPIGDHLRRIITLLAHNEENRKAVQEVLLGRPCPSYETFYHLRSAGILVGDSATEARPRCRLYADYLSRHLL